MKGGDVIIVFALRALRAAGVLDQMGVQVVMTGDEESRGMPHAMQNRFPIEFIDQAEAIRLRLEMWDNSRTIHMAEDAGNGLQQASPLGYSVGRWENNSLVVTTTNIDWPYFDEIGTPQSPEIEVEERFTLSADDTVLDYQITITDPNTLLEPAVRHGRWVWIPGEQIQTYGCTVTSTTE